VDAATYRALERFKQTGRRLILVTGRDLVNLHEVFPQTKLFDRVVAENGALLFDPATEQERVIAPAPPAGFIDALKQRNVMPLRVGRSIVATWEPNEKTVLEVIHDLGLELQIIFNKGAVMVLPPGVNKAAGLAAALRELDLTPPNVVGVGDAENDHAFLRSCGCAAAVANALPAVKEEADIRLAGDHGAGVIELVEIICRDDARIVPPQRHGILVGPDRYDREIYLEPNHGSVLIAGSSGIGKSTLATALTERMIEKNLEFCIFDPEGDYDELEHAVSTGDAKAPPMPDEAFELLRKLAANVVINTQALSAAERPAFFAKLLPRIASLRARTGRPHWLLIDEAHHVMSAPRDDVGQILPEKIPASIFITVHPDAMSPDALKTVEFVLALGDAAAQTIAMFCRTIGVAAPANMPRIASEEILFWARSSGNAPFPVKVVRPKQTRDRHKRKYAEGELGEDNSFYFRGPENKLNLRAQNLMLFNQIAEGVDEGTWEHHRRAGDYSAWFRKVIKDEELAREAAGVESDDSIDAAESRKRIIAAVSRRYTASSRGQRSQRS
jgi:hydroxymethylpyrimidine pyrophosphatase-like HAD family hydrolase